MFVYGCRFQVWKNTFPVTQCSGCWKFGHFLKFCPVKKLLCPKCGGEHNNCEKSDIKCLNCKGNHLVLDKTCPLFLKEKAIKEIMSHRNISYKQALHFYLQDRESKRVESREFSNRSVDFEASDSTLSSMVCKGKEVTSMNSLNGPDIMNSKISYADKVRNGNKNQMKAKPASQIISYPKKIKKRRKEHRDVKQESQAISFPSEHKDNKGKEKNKNPKEKNESESEKFEFKRFFTKIKEIILCDSSYEEKVMSVLSCFVTEFKLFVCNLLKEGNIFRGLFNILNG